ncbi:MAG: GntR family transcriptional regulator [Desulfobulbaceae bacterium]|nr:MAG: GntR family transcriptional regulator [Desulfobulbaceae bacterium]
MAEIGRINTLTVKRLRDYGAHLDGGPQGDIRLPYRDVPPHCRPGDKVEVFVYPSEEGQLRATTRKPKAMVGRFAKLRVVAAGPGGAFLDWGMAKDLFVPKAEQQGRMEPGRSYIVYLFFDEKGRRILASSRLARFLNQQPGHYQEGQEVDLLIHEQTDLGYRAIVNHSHEGMLYKNEVFQKIFSGQQLRGYVKKVRDDGKLDLLLRKPGYQGVDAIALDVFRIIKRHGGSMAVTDKSRPEEIYALFGVSKKLFKKAIGALYKKKLITIDAKGIRLGKG